jgi:hypothetical protein
MAGLVPAISILGWRLCQNRAMPRSRLIQMMIVLALFSAGAMLSSAHAQEIDFGQIDKFESLGTGTLRVGDAPKTLIDDGEHHVVVLTVWDADAETKVYWKSFDGTPRTTTIPGRGVQTFQTAGDLRLEAVGDPYHEVKYGYVLLGAKSR